jgi:hypothetical protein
MVDMDFVNLVYDPVMWMVSSISSHYIVNWRDIVGKRWFIVGIATYVSAYFRIIIYSSTKSNLFNLNTTYLLGTIVITLFVKLHYCHLMNM